MPPPPEPLPVTWLSLIVESATISESSPKSWMPPPLNGALFWSIVVRRMS